MLVHQMLLPTLVALQLYVASLNKAFILLLHKQYMHVSNRPHRVKTSTHSKHTSNTTTAFFLCFKNLLRNKDRLIQDFLLGVWGRWKSMKIAVYFWEMLVKIES